jgi:hypothetical protein
MTYMNTYNNKLKIPDDVLCTVLIENLDMQACSKVKASLWSNMCCRAEGSCCFKAAEE